MDEQDRILETLSDDRLALHEVSMIVPVTDEYADIDVCEVDDVLAWEVPVESVEDSLHEVYL